jgi:glycosyltransferase involved in cell wall biosynthesis
MSQPETNNRDASFTIALVSTERRWQGGEEQARQLARGLRQEGHRCLFAALRDGVLAARMSEEGFEVLSLCGRSAWPHRCWALRRQLKHQQVDIVHFNDSRAITIGGLSAWRIPHTVTVASRRASFPIRSASRYNWLCDRVFCVSTHVAELCSQAGIPDSRLKVVHDGVDPQRMEGGDRARGRRGLAIGDEVPLLLAVGSLAPCKGHRYLIEAMPNVLREFPNLQLAIAGDGVLNDELHRLIGELRLEDHVQLLGFRDDVPDLVQACDLFVFPSIEEGLGSTLIDVMLAERPIVATTAGGIPDVVGPIDSSDPAVAWLAEPGNSGSLSQSICRGLLSNPHTEDFIARGRQRALRQFTVDHMVRQTLNGYRDALAESS